MSEKPRVITSVDPKRSVPMTEARNSLSPLTLQEIWIVGKDQVAFVTDEQLAEQLCDSLDNLSRFTPTSDDDVIELIPKFYEIAPHPIFIDIRQLDDDAFHMLRTSIRQVMTGNSDGKRRSSLLKVLLLTNPNQVDNGRNLSKQSTSNLITCVPAKA